MRYVLQNTEGKYAGLNKKRAWCVVDSFEAAEKLTMTKANNVKRNCLKSPGSWTLVNAAYDPDVLGKGSKVSDYVEQLESIAESLKNMVVSLTAELSAMDRQAQDVMHYIEFNQFGAADGYKAYKLLHDCLKERRQVKDDIFIVHAMYDGRIREISQGTLQQALLRLENRKYIPRQLPELFAKKDNKIV